MAINIENIEDLKNILRLYDIDFSKWGTNIKSKTVNKLFEEITKKDSFLVVKNGELLRESESVWVNVSRFDKKNLVLRERNHSTENGTIIKKRGNNHPLTEKKSPGESFSSAIRRGIKEELGLNKQYITVHLFQDEVVNITNSLSYPGLKAKYTKLYGKATIKASGLQEKQNIQNMEFVIKNASNGKLIRWEWVKTKPRFMRIIPESVTRNPSISGKVPGKSINQSIEAFTNLKEQLKKVHNSKRKELNVLNNPEPYMYILLGPMGSGKSSFDYKQVSECPFRNFKVNNTVESAQVYKEGMNNILKNVNNKNTIDFATWKSSISNEMRNSASKLYGNVRTYGRLSENKLIHIKNSILRHENIMIEATGGRTTNIYKTFETTLKPLLENENYRVHFIYIHAEEIASYNRGLQREYTSYKNGKTVRLTPKLSKYKKSYENIQKTVGEKMIQYSKYDIVKSIVQIDTTNLNNLKKHVLK